MLAEECKDLGQVLSVFGSVLACYQDVVQVHESIRKVSEYAIHEALEGLCRVLQAERHAEELEEAEGGDDGSFLDVLTAHGNLVVPFHHVDLGEDGATRQPFVEGLDVRQGIGVCLRGRVQPPIVSARSKFAIGFRYDV